MQATIGLLICGALLGFAQDPAANHADGTWILQVEGNAKTLAVKNAVRKPFEFRARRGPTSDYRVTLVDKDGRTLSSVPLDLSVFCLDEDHIGNAAHVRGDVVFEHKIVSTVKLPARTDAAEIRIENVKNTDKPVLLGKIDTKSLTTMIRKRETGKKEVK